IAVLPGDSALVMLQLTDSRTVPVDLKSATPLIEMYLTNQRRGEVATKEVKQLRTEAKIEYQGEFIKTKETLAAEARAEAEGKARAKSEAEAKLRADTEAKAKASAEADADAKARAEQRAKTEAVARAEKEAAGKEAGSKPAGASLSKDSISKGLSGLR